MGLYHSVGIAYGFEIPNTVDIDAIDDALRDQPNARDGIGWLVIGDRDKTLLVTEYKRAEENTVIPVTPEFFARYEVPAWNKALHEAAVRIGYPEHPAPAWLVIHDYS
ncbi:hypothetical protein [Streptomyces sp. NBC_01373]|uniref:hypothetical protein n=1 Tax=Streptomyces sp. NBC_01373 TaxID=2903843 RepID=UPI002259D2BE|nr:hypothetical protein [Streptomyces sp. NBC_01373]MCX4697049.1 hypothetical protein [Streptomyces sp. NBC_01373]MCX4707026.1 hypothetical protein [Streptomyces sp. NBC_01373]